MNEKINLGKERFLPEGCSFADNIIQPKDEPNNEYNLKESIKKVIRFASHIGHIRYEKNTLMFTNFLSNECKDVIIYLSKTFNWYCYHRFDFFNNYRYGLNDLYYALTEIRTLLTLIKKDQNSIKGKLMGHKDSKYIENKLVTYHLNYLNLAIKYSCVTLNFNYNDLEKESLLI